MLDQMRTVADYQVIDTVAGGGRLLRQSAVPPSRLGLPVSQVSLTTVDIPCSAAQFEAAVVHLRTIERIGSPQVADFYDAVHTDRLSYASEYFAAGSLAAAAPRLPVGQRLQAIADAARGAHDMHEAGVAHGNITPASIVPTVGGGKLTDPSVFGIVAADQPVTACVAPDSVAYLDPALLAGGEPDRATDIWSLGACLHFAATGAGVYGTDGSRPDSQMSAARRALSSPPVLSEQIGPVLRELISACLALTGDRPATAAEVAERIDSLR